jgi:hypothetical protein
MTSAPRKPIVIVGWVLVGLAFAAMLVVAVIATFEGGGASGVAFRGSGRPGLFMPVVYLPLLLAFFGVGAYWLWRRMHKRHGEGEASNSTPHPDTRGSAVPRKGPSARAGGRGR